MCPVRRGHSGSATVACGRDGRSQAWRRRSRCRQCRCSSTRCNLGDPGISKREGGRRHCAKYNRLVTVRPVPHHPPVCQNSKAASTPTPLRRSRLRLPKRRVRRRTGLRLPSLDRRTAAESKRGASLSGQAGKRPLATTHARKTCFALPESLLTLIFTHVTLEQIPPIVDLSICRSVDH